MDDKSFADFSKGVSKEDCPHLLLIILELLKERIKLKKKEIFIELCLTLETASKVKNPKVSLKLQLSVHSRES